MTIAAQKVRYRKETIAAFEQTMSVLRETVTTDTEADGSQVTFLVSGSGGATAVTRGQNGLIPSRIDENVQSTCQLVEWHDSVEKTRFNIFASQGKQKEMMQDTTVSVLNRKIDDDIITALAGGTQAIANTTGSYEYILRARTMLMNNKVTIGTKVTGLITPAYEAYMRKIPEFTSADYTKGRPSDNALTEFEWLGMRFIVHQNLPGAGTADETVLFYHKDAIGHAADSKSLNTAIGYDEKNDFSWARATIFMGSLLLQNEGVIVGSHDGSLYSS